MDISCTNGDAANWCRCGSRQSAAVRDRGLRWLQSTSKHGVLPPGERRVAISCTNEHHAKWRRYRESWPHVATVAMWHLWAYNYCIHHVLHVE